MQYISDARESWNNLLFIIIIIEFESVSKEKMNKYLKL